MRKLSYIFLFAVTFALVEAAVVVYLQRILYPEGFSFPLRPHADPILRVELAREAATIIVLLAAALAADPRGWARFSLFMVAFGTWDILYYAWLWLFLGWPRSLMDWDILFLIPVPWVGPVLAPVLVSLALVAAGTLVFRRLEGGGRFALGPLGWTLAVLSALLVLASMVWLGPLVMAGGVPKRYPWELFFAGWLLGLAVFAWKWR
ncbi:MAG: hypothetical protein ACE5JJ_12055, partial [Nitrospinota bacterium]